MTSYKIRNMYIKDKCLYIHIPKTGGSTLESKCEKIYKIDEPNHKTTTEYKEQLGEEIYDNTYKFTFCRHPLRILISMFMYYLTRQTRENVALALTGKSGLHLDTLMWTEIQHWTSLMSYKYNKKLIINDFRVFVNRIIVGDFHDCVYNGFEPVIQPHLGQRSYLTEGVDDIFKLEEFDKCIPIIKKHTDIDLSNCPRINVTLDANSVDLKEWYGDELYKKTCDTFAEDIKFFGYLKE